MGWKVFSAVETHGRFGLKLKYSLLTDEHTLLGYRVKSARGYVSRDTSLRGEEKFPHLRIGLQSREKFYSTEKTFHTTEKSFFFYRRKDFFIAKKRFPRRRKPFLGTGKVSTTDKTFSKYMVVFISFCKMVVVTHFL